MAVRINKRRLKAYPKAAELEQELNSMVTKMKGELDLCLKRLIENYPDTVFEMYEKNPNMGVIKDIMIAGLLEQCHQYVAPGSVVQMPKSGGMVGHRAYSKASNKRIYRLFHRIGVM